MRRSMTVALVAAFLMSAGARAQTETLPERVARLERELAAIKEQIKRTTSTSGQPGTKGEKRERGPQGPPGPQGNPGPPGTLAIPGLSFMDGQINLRDQKGYVLLAASSSGGILRFNNSEEKTVAYLGGGLMTLASSTGTDVVVIHAADAGGFASFKDNAGKEVLYIGAVSNGSGVVKINGEYVKDYAEVFELATRQGVEPGTVMSVTSPEARIAPSAAPYERRVVGVISGAGGLHPGAVVGSREDGSNDLPLAVSGQVYVRICLEGGPIEPGDLLVASSERGVAMRAADLDQAAGAVVGKALETFGSGQGKEGLVRMMVMLR